MVVRGLGTRYPHGRNAHGRRASSGVRLLPVAHFAVALVPVLAYVAVRDRRLPSLSLVGIVFVGGLFPDFIDKPLAHLLSVIPSGRVFMHSLPIAVPVWLVVLGYGWKTGRLRLGGAFVFAYASHLVADNYRALLGEDPHVPSDLFWPFMAPVARAEVPYWIGLESVGLYIWTGFSFVVVALLVYVVVVDLRAQLA